jgi:hypothetical protein
MCCIAGHVPYLLKPDYFKKLTEWSNEYGGIFKMYVNG